MKHNELSPQMQQLSRRGLLATTASGAAAMAANVGRINLLQAAPYTEQLKSNDKRVILLWLAGGASQLETWDPKPGAKNGGPYRAIPTNVSGMSTSVNCCPQLAQRMQHTAIIRSLNTRIADHGNAASLMETGRVADPGLKFPDLGAVVARELGRIDSKVPDYVSLYTATEGRRKGTSGVLGSRYAPMFLSDSMIPPNLTRPESSDRYRSQRSSGTARPVCQKLLAEPQECNWSTVICRRTSECAD